MKFFLFSLMFLFANAFSYANTTKCYTSAFQSYLVKPPISERKIQIAILFDTSNSMDGLIEQAKSSIWSIINEATSYRYSNEVPQLEIALYHYGNNGLSVESNYIQLLLPFTTDIDEVSKQLFALKTNGGNEYCGAVIQKSVNELNWSTHPNDLKLIFIAGNEPFNQGPIKHKEACQLSFNKKITVNTVYCGDANQGIREFWKDCADLAQGSYFNIDANKSIQHIDAPQDQEISLYNDSLNKTYYGYGTYGIQKKAEQENQDKNAKGYSSAVESERAISKSKVNYSNESWDLVDAYKKDKNQLDSLKDEQLPLEFKNKTKEEKQKLIEEKTKERAKYQEKISQLAIERQKYIDEEMKKKSPSEDNFGTSVNKSIKEKAEKLGFVKEVKP